MSFVVSNRAEGKSLKLNKDKRKKQCLTERSITQSFLIVYAAAIFHQVKGLFTVFEITEKTI